MKHNYLQLCLFVAGVPANIDKPFITQSEISDTCSIAPLWIGFFYHSACLLCFTQTFMAIPDHSITFSEASWHSLAILHHLIMNIGSHSLGLFPDSSVNLDFHKLVSFFFFFFLTDLWFVFWGFKRIFETKKMVLDGFIGFFTMDWDSHELVSYSRD